MRRWIDPTVTASVMIARILDEGKVGCHKGVWKDNAKIRRRTFYYIPSYFYPI